MNDRSEFTYATKLVGPLVEDFVKDMPEDVSGSAAAIRKIWSILPHGPRPYVMCFCENGNLLSQWREYAGKGAGFAIGVGTESLAPLLQKQKYVTFLSKVVYDETQQRHIVSSLLDMWRVRLENAEFDPNSYLWPFHLSTDLQACMALFKNQAFSEEMEWRFVTYRPSTGSGDTLFRPSRTSIVPYVELDLGVIRASPIMHIVLGSQVDPEAGKESMGAFLKTLGYKDVEIENSGIPLRH